MTIENLTNTTPFILIIAALLSGVSIAAVAFAIIYSILRKRNAASNKTSLASANTRFLLALSNDAIVITDTKLGVINFNPVFKTLLGVNIVMDQQHLSDFITIASEQGGQIDISTLAQFKDSDFVTHPAMVIVDKTNARKQVHVSVYRVASAASQPVYVWKFINTSAAKDIVQEQSEFISVISHELRTPVAVMEASTSSLLSSTEAGLSVSQKKLILATRENAMLLSKLLTDLSVYSTLQSGTLTTDMSSISPRMMLDQMQKVFTSQAEDKNIVLVVDHDQNVRNVISGEAHILSILQNYIKNAIQFSKPGGIVIIATKVASDGVIFMVRDTGAVISPDMKQKIFDTTFHAHDDTEHQTLQGAGIGLYISAKLAKSIGATMWVESEPGKGSSFYLKVPVSYAPKESVRSVHNLELSKFAQDI